MNIALNTSVKPRSHTVASKPTPKHVVKSVACKTASTKKVAKASEKTAEVSYDFVGVAG